MEAVPIKEEPMVVDQASDLASRPVGDTNQQTLPSDGDIETHQHPQQEHPMQSTLVDSQPSPNTPSIHPLQQQQQQQSDQQSVSPFMLAQPLTTSVSAEQNSHEQASTPDENNLHLSTQSSQMSPPDVSQSQQNAAPQKTSTFSPNVNYVGPTMTKGNILEAIKDFDSSIPDAVVHHFLNVAGMQTSDQRIVRLIAIAAQKFIHDIVSDSLQHCKLRGAQNKKTKEKKYTLTMEDLSSALAEYGIEVKRPLYFN